MAGPNAGGTLLVHTDSEVQYSAGQTYCAPALGACESATTTAASGNTAVCYVIAAFPSGASPRLSGVTFGIDYDPAVISILDHGTCADFEITTPGWPASGEGTGLSWLAPRTDLLVPIYWFAAYGYPGLTGQLRLQGHPGQGGSFADDHIPALLDPVAGFGALGFGIPGTLVCPMNGGGAPEGGEPPPSAPNTALVRFQPGVLSFPESYDHPGASFVAPLADATCSDPGLLSTLTSLGAETFETIAPSWRFQGTSPLVGSEGGTAALVDFTDTYRIRFTPGNSVGDILAALQAHLTVARAEGDILFSANAGNDPRYPEQWGLNNTGQTIQSLPCIRDYDINAPEAWAISTKLGTKIAIFDSPFNRDHEDLKDRFDPDLSMSLVDSVWWSNQTGGGHGTQVASVVAAIADNGKGITGLIHQDSTATGSLVAMALHGFEVPPADPLVTLSDIARGLDTLRTVPYANSTRVANISFGYYTYRGCYTYPTVLRDAMRNAFISGLFITCSGGNEPMPTGQPCSVTPPDSLLNWPAGFEDYALAVTAIDCEGEPKPGYAIGSYLDLAAPGNDILVAVGGDTPYVYEFGSSLAAPHAAGAAALLLGIDSTLTNEDCAELLKRTTKSLSPYPSIQVGTGLLRLDAAMSQIAAPAALKHDSTTTCTANYLESQWVELKQVPELGIGEVWDSVWVKTYELRSIGTLSCPDSMRVGHLWPRGRTSTGIRRIDATMGYRYDGHFHANHAEVASLAGMQAEFVSYTYKVYADDTEAQFLCWYPYRPAGDPDSCGASTRYRLDYSYTYAPLDPSEVAVDPGCEGCDRLTAQPSVSEAGQPIKLAWSARAGQPFELQVIDVGGREVRSLARGRAAGGASTMDWDLADDAGHRVGAGVYVIRLAGKGGKTSRSTRVVILK